MLFKPKHHPLDDCKGMNDVQPSSSTLDGEIYAKQTVAKKNVVRTVRGKAAMVYCL